MGTIISSFPALFYPHWEFKQLHETFQGGLSNHTRVVKNQEYSKASRKTEEFEFTLWPEASTGGKERVQRSSTKESRHPSSTLHPAARSALSTPINRSRRTSNVTLGNNNESQSVTGPEVELSKITTAAKKSDMTNSNNANIIANQIPFRPESWPTLELIREHLNKRQSLPTTILFARFAPRNTKNTFIEIKYSSNKDTNETVFSLSDKVDLLIPSKERYQVGESEQEQIDYFFLIFKTCINLLQGQVWWNGYSLILDQNSTKNRLKVSAFEMEPSQLLFELTNMSDLEVHRSGHKLQMRSKITIENQNQGGPAGTSTGPAAAAATPTTEEYKTFAFRAVTVKGIKVNKLRGTLITVHLPDFNLAMLPPSL